MVDGDLDRINIIATAYGTVGDFHLRQTSKTVKWWNGRRASSTGQILDRPMTTWMICKTSIAILLSGALQFVPTGDAFAGPSNACQKACTADFQACWKDSARDKVAKLICQRRQQMCLHQQQC